MREQKYFPSKKVKNHALHTKQHCCRFTKRVIYVQRI
jgi:hypothetical protein